jgi:hypothetical protein
LKPNFHVQQEIARLKAEYEAGIDEGYSASLNELPEFFLLPYTQLYARQRGYIFGRELKMQELMEESI